MKKKVIFSTFIIALNFLLVASVSAGPILDKILKNGELTIGTTGTQPPMTFLAKNGRINGMDADIARELGLAMGLDVKFISLPFSELLPALASQKIDMVLSGMTMTTQRNQKVAFAGPYYVSGKGILAKAEKYAVLKHSSGLNDAKVRVAALEGSTSLNFTQSMMSKATLTRTSSHDEAIQLLLNGKVDILVADFPFCALSAHLHRDKRLFAGKAPLTYEPLGIAMMEDALLINMVQNFLIQIAGDGRLKDIQEKWLSEGSWIDSIQ